MPCLLKKKTDRSPGVISLTQNEFLYGIAGFSRRVREHLVRSHRAGEYIYGIHIQGSCHHLESWPLEEWQSFVMWGDPSDRFLHNVPKEMVTPITCTSLMPAIYPPKEPRKVYDLAVISRPAEIKRIVDVLHILRGLLDRKPDLRVTLMIPDSRKFAQGDRTFELEGLDRRFYELPKKLFSSKELWNNLSFICTSDDIFGRFPLAPELMQDQLAQSRFLLSFSEREGAPRAFAEAQMLGVPVIYSKNLHSSMSGEFSPRSALAVENDVPKAVEQIHDALVHYDRYQVDDEGFRRKFSEKYNRSGLQTFLESRLKAAGHLVEGEWLLNDLNVRLPCHGKRHNYQVTRSSELFFSWLENIQKYDPYDEDLVLGTEPLDDTARGLDAIDLRLKKARDLYGRVRRIDRAKVGRRFRSYLQKTS